MTKSKSANWDLSKLHHTLKLNESTALMDQINEKATLFSTTYKSTIHTLTALELYNAIKNYEAIKSELYQISQFAHLNYAVNFKDQDILKFVTRIDEFTSTISNILLFFFLAFARTAAIGASIESYGNKAFVLSRPTYNLFVRNLPTSSSLLKASL